MAQVPPLTGAMTHPSMPGETPLVLGAVSFGSEECPNDLEFSGKQRTTVKEYDGGGRVVQSHGPQPDQVRWNGAFYVTANVQQKVSTLRSYMVSGAEYLATYNVERYYVKIIEFSVTYKHKARVGYKIALEVTRDANGAYSTMSPVSLDSQVGALMTSATTSYGALLATDPDLSIPATALPTLQQSIAKAGPLAAQGAGSSAVLNAAQVALSAAQAYASNVTENDARFLPTTRLISALTLIERNVQQGQSPSSVRVQNGSTYEIASQVYGDITKAFALARAIGSPTPRLPSTRLVTVLLPPLGGIR